jgi:hypothetical protein
VAHPLIAADKLIDAGRLDAQVSSQFKSGRFGRDRRAFFCGFRRSPGLCDRLPTSISSALGFASTVSSSPERLPNEKYSSSRYGGFHQRSNEHPHGPPRHILLGLKVFASAPTFFGGFWVIVRSFERAGDALDVILNGGRQYWIRVWRRLGLVRLGAGLSAAVPTYWLSECAG